MICFENSCREKFLLKMCNKKGAPYSVILKNWEIIPNTKPDHICWNCNSHDFYYASMYILDLCCVKAGPLSPSFHTHLWFYKFCMNNSSCQVHLAGRYWKQHGTYLKIGSSLLKLFLTLMLFHRGLSYKPAWSWKELIPW